MDSSTTHTAGGRADSTADGSLGAEVRESLLLLCISVGVTAAVTIAAQATLLFLN
jgi:hypothetical protein